MTDRATIEAWLARIAIGDRQAFVALYDATSAKLFGVLLRILNDRDTAEDALQDVYLKIWHNAHRYRVNGFSPMTWLITVARNHAIDRLRRQRGSGGGAVPDAVDAVADPAPGPEARAIAAGEAARLAACFDELDQTHADAVRRAYLEGETYAELAERFDVPLNTMRTRLRRSLLKLKECLTR
ncbi:sigma-70 family RNA polymerase sigma factor [Lutimaribacter sp. EGI FJ00015]|uniref:Sigma-70 family RNA polymerase sigma factor n=1 Tax=Lutimaribacter degradans TaxID=2945989 RepID=A0ACC5ZS87_9RHOB|nr:sigma-70 family RNA polymerase sigma factor [Lutimaribacter sp. EGI FJ00013]MCM2560720.1 sigma-70 family RNA polymerase sigma factor [Lutimaribacter sp. EGI FJ00013]MCO0612335.1 sigma-70 family RNA polymerase sigma factor [Lutimaribacter sp. EGI FJ00015]MCO0634545.1 sigma-70 family RNA polymerase sigma factor [Lutimaribacter sp. EGI FJ00014]